MWYFYVLQSQTEPDYFHKGSMNDLRRRFTQHQSGEVDSTRPRRPYRLVYYEAYLTEHAARIREHAVKASGSVSVPLLRRIKESLEYSNSTSSDPCTKPK
jgi:putative endonuclease